MWEIGGAMSREQQSRMCRACGTRVLAERQAFGCMEFAVHAIVCLFTAGLWLPVMLIHLGASLASGFKCQRCGRKV